MIYDFLKQISINTLILDASIYSDKENKEKWIGRPAATDVEIAKSEKRLGIKLPKDVTDFYKTSNGTSEILKHNFGDFTPIENIDWLKNTIPKTLINYAEMGEAYVNDLKNSIIIAGVNHVHNILIIQPYGKYKKWRYWEFAHYIPGENEFKGIENYLERLDNFLKEQVKNKNETD